MLSTVFIKQRGKFISTSDYVDVVNELPLKQVVLKNSNLIHDGNNYWINFTYLSSQLRITMIHFP